MRRLIISGFSLLLIVAVGILEGKISHRWGPSNDLKLASTAVETLPETIGDWESEKLEIEEQTLTLAGATGHLKRIYRNPETGEWHVVTLLCGKHGPISLHAPTLCFTGSGWRAAGPEKVVEYSPREGMVAQAWQVAFDRREDFKEEHIMVDWTWNDGSGWRATDNARFEYAGAPYLFKLYVVSDGDQIGGEGKARRDQFVKSLLKELDRTVFDSLTSTNTQDGAEEL